MPLALSGLDCRRMAEEQGVWLQLRRAQETWFTNPYLHVNTRTFTSSGVTLVRFEWLPELPPYFRFQASNLHGLLAAAWFTSKPCQLRDVLLAAFAILVALTHIPIPLFVAVMLVPIVEPYLDCLCHLEENTAPNPACRELFHRGNPH